MSQIQWITL